MLRPLGPSLSGINASFKLLDAASSNIANARTDGYKAKKISFQENSGSIAVLASTDNSPGPRYQLDNKVFEGSNVDIASEMISLITARHTLSVNLAAFRTASEMEKSTIDTLA